MPATESAGKFLTCHRSSARKTDRRLDAIVKTYSKNIIYARSRADEYGVSLPPNIESVIRPAVGRHGVEILTFQRCQFGPFLFSLSQDPAGRSGHPPAKSSRRNKLPSIYGRGRTRARSSIMAIDCSYSARRLFSPCLFPVTFLLLLYSRATCCDRPASRAKTPRTKILSLGNGRKEGRQLDRKKVASPGRGINGLACSLALRTRRGVARVSYPPTPTPSSS